MHNMLLVVDFHFVSFCKNRSQVDIPVKGNDIGIKAAAPHEWNPSPLARAIGTLDFMNNNVRKKPKDK